MLCVGTFYWYMLKYQRISVWDSYISSFGTERKTASNFYKLRKVHSSYIFFCPSPLKYSKLAYFYSTTKLDIIIYLFIFRKNRGKKTVWKTFCQTLCYKGFQHVLANFIVQVLSSTCDFCLISPWGGLGNNQSLAGFWMDTEDLDYPRGASQVLHKFYPLAVQE